MRKRKKTDSRPFGQTSIPSAVQNDAKTSDKFPSKNQRIFEEHELLFKMLSGVLVPLVVALVTLFAAAWQFNAINERTDRARFLDAALATAQETNVLLDEGYNALEKLLEATNSHGWKAFSTEALREYIEHHRHWRQRAVSEHFKLTRYFGRDLADQLIHIDEIDLHLINNLASPNLCTPPGNKDNYDFEKLTLETRCTITFISIMQDSMDNPRADQSTNEFLQLSKEKREQEDFTRELLKHYDKARVGYLRELDRRLTQLGQPGVTVVSRPTSAVAGGQ